MPQASDFFANGQLSDAAVHYLQSFGKLTEQLSGAAQTYTDDRLLSVRFPEEGDYTLWRNTPYAITIKNTTSKSSAGTATATFKIGSTPLGGTANSVSTSEQVQAHSTANEVAVGGDVIVTISANSGCEGMDLTVEYERASTNV